MHSDLKKSVVAAIEEHWTKGTKEMVKGYTNKSFVKLMEWMYVKYGQITPV